MRSFYHCLDMFVLASFFDPVGNVVPEALACGLKALCSSRAGASDFLPPEQVLEDPADAGEIADRVRKLRAAETVAPFSSGESGIGEMILLLERLLAEKRPAADGSASLP